ncbi:MAG: amino acid adenylation domain-containing protein, partial [Rhodospirillaceae bacterium]|nr:amino acid adenylation domain-containing protein [Rhodospirillaceae bacterium]
LFQISFSYQNLTGVEELARHMVLDNQGRSVGFGSLEIQPIALPQQEGLFDLTLEIVRDGDGLIPAFKYNRDLYDGATVRMLLSQYATLLQSIASSGDCLLGSLSVQTEAERSAVLSGSCGAVADWAVEPVHRGFERWAAGSPDLAALWFEGRGLSYGELDRRANALARRLIAAGAGADRPVAICAERSLELMIGVLAILKAGAAYLPLDADYPAARLGDMLADSGASLVLLQERLAGRLSEAGLSETGVSRILLDGLAEAGVDDAAAAAAAPAVSVGPDHLAYVIYTSGSTGRPKGVMTSHGAIDNRLRWMQEAFGLEAGERVLQKTPLSFDVSVWELFWPLREGACLVLAAPGGHRDGAYLASLIGDASISTLHFVPAMLRAFLETPEVGRSCASVRRIICSGEALGSDLARLCESRIGAPLYNLYGPTEASVDVTWQRYEPARHRGVSVPIGEAIANTRCLVLDRHMQLTPAGAVGELYLGGIGLARGYWRRPDLTAAAFVPDPHSALPGARLYRTGDLVRRLSDGGLEYLGRGDHQIKLRGQRIELGEIEAALNEHPGVGEAAVTVWRVGDDAGDQRLAAYVRGDALPPPSQLADWLGRRLPAAMIPAAFVTLERLPLTASGKIDRGALPEPDSWGRAATERTAPRTPGEELLAQIWMAVLDLDDIAVEDDFFELGGHSLLALRVAARVRRAFNAEPPLALLFDHPRLADQARAIAKLAETETQPLPPITPAPRNKTIPLSPSQRRFWFFEHFAPEASAYNL